MSPGLLGQSSLSEACGSLRDLGGVRPGVSPQVTDSPSPPRTLYIQGERRLDFTGWLGAIQKAAASSGDTLSEQQLGDSDIPVIVYRCVDYITQCGEPCPLGTGPAPPRETPSHLPPVGQVPPSQDASDSSCEAPPLAQSHPSPGLTSEGIYRKCGQTSKTQRLLESLRQDARSVRLKEGEQHVDDVSSALKRFLRDLPDGLFTRAQRLAWLDTSGGPRRPRPA